MKTWDFALESAETAVRQCREIASQMDFEGIPFVYTETTKDDPAVLAIATVFMNILRDRGLVTHKCDPDRMPTVEEECDDS